eukprot:1343209-Amorphochlora_amoeboformis.AAC.1
MTRPLEKGMTRNAFKSLMYLNYIHSLACPGESVGVLAAQSGDVAIGHSYAIENILDAFP